MRKSLRDRPGSEGPDFTPSVINARIKEREEG